MGKYGKYAKRYKDIWEKDPVLSKFISRTPDNLLAQGKPEAYCKICRTPLRAQKNDLLKHAETRTHKANAASLNRGIQHTLQEYGLQPNAAKKEDELKVSVYMAMHGSINCVDHLTDTLKQLNCGTNTNTKLDKLELQLHRTKCSKLITNVIAPAFLTELVQDIGDKPFSIILDESTDVTDIKYMAYCVRYYSYSQKQIATDFLGFSEVERATAEDLYANFTDFMRKVGLNLTNLIGIGTDGASNLCGVNNSLYTLIKRDFPQIHLFRCVCHSLHLAAAKACEEMPSNLEVLLRETRNWFSHSSLRKIQYRDVYKVINEEKAPPKLVQLCATRWLCWSGAVATNLDQWLELKTLFTMVSSKTGPEKCYTARILSSMYSDDANYLYLLFLNPILKHVAKVNLAFQKSNADVSLLYADLKRLIISMAKRFVKPSFMTHHNHITPSNDSMAEIQIVRNAMDKLKQQFGSSLLSIDDIDFGDTFLTYAAKKTVSASELATVKERCLGFMVRLTKELLARLPSNLKMLDQISILSPRTCITGTTHLFRNLPWDLAAHDVNREAIESQCRVLQTFTIGEIDMNFKHIAEVDIVTFWIRVSELRNAQGDLMFQDLAEVALRALSLPISNAIVERVFSVMSIVKTKLRNRMNIPMLVALIRIRVHLSVKNTCCKDFKPTSDMLKRFNSSMYKITDTEANSDDENRRIAEAYTVFHKFVNT